MKYSNTKEYPHAVTCTLESVKELKARGWTVDLHTDYYATFIGFRRNGVEVGFYNWFHNLDTGIGTYDHDLGIDPKFGSQDDVEMFVQIVDNLIKLMK